MPVGLLGNARKTSLVLGRNERQEPVDIGDVVALRRAPESGAQPVRHDRELEEARLRHDDLIARAHEHAGHDIEELFGAVAADDALRIEREMRCRSPGAIRRSQDRDSG